MITIHYRPLAGSREYDSIRLPLPDARRAVRQAAYGAATRDEIADGVPMVTRRRTDSYATLPAWALRGDVPAGLNVYPRAPVTYSPTLGRPDPLGDAVARGLTPCLVCGVSIGNDAQARQTGCCSGSCARTAGARGSSGPRSRARTTTEIPIAVDATLPAIAAALDRLKESLGRNGTAAQLMAVDAIAKAIEALPDHMWPGERLEIP